ncbi:MAG: hypothetical protein CME06_04590 [Gemmatimonadetes bacterium]|nr:hypothetical protein [Gemmatimonadota bacterium]
MAVAGGQAFIAAAGGVLVVDVDVDVEGEIPVRAEVEIDGDPRGVAVFDAGGVFPVLAVSVRDFGGTGRDGIAIVEVRPAGVDVLGWAVAPATGEVEEPAVAGDLVLVRTETGFLVFDAREREHPHWVGRYDAILQGAERVNDVVGRADVAYLLVDDQPCLQIVDLEDPSAPAYVGSRVESTTLAQKGTFGLRAPLLAGTCSTRHDTPAHSLHSFKTGTDTWTSSIGLDAEDSRVAALDGGCAVVYTHAPGEAGRERLRIFDVGEPEGAPLVKATLGLGSRIYAMAILGDTVAVVGHGGWCWSGDVPPEDLVNSYDTYDISTVDLRNPENPVILDVLTVDLPWSLYCSARKPLAVREDGIGIFSGGFDLHVIDVADPSAIQHLATLEGEDGQVAAIEGSTAVVSQVEFDWSYEWYQRLTTIDLSEPTEPQVVARWSEVYDGPTSASGGDAADLEIRDGHAWILGHIWKNYYGGLQDVRGKLYTVDITDPTTPELVETIDLDLANDLAFADSLLYIAEGRRHHRGPGRIAIRRIVGPGRSIAVSELRYGDYPTRYPGAEARVLPFGLGQVLCVRGKDEGYSYPGESHQIDAFLPEAPADLAIGTPITSARTVPFGDIALINDNIVVSAAGNDLEIMPLRYGSPGVPWLIAERVLPVPEGSDR